MSCRGALLVVVIAFIIYCFLQPYEMNGLRDDVDVYDIKQHLHLNVFGQPLVYTILPKVLKEYNENERPGPLILAFHGTPGTGKNFVSNLLAQKFFVNGQESKFFHTFLATKDFPVTTDEQQLLKYRENLPSRLKYLCNPEVDGYFFCWLAQFFYDPRFGDISGKRDTICRRLYIFDEVDSLPDNFLDRFSSFMMSPYFNKTIFVFLSNVGGEEIFKEVENHEIHNLRKDQINHNELVRVVQDKLATSPPKYNPSMVDHIIPFLPLQRNHVAMCIRKEITRRMPFIKEKDLIRLTENVMKELLFHGTGDKYAVKGCKNAVEKVNLVLAREKLSK